MLLCGMLIGGLGCHDLIGTATLPPGTQGPDTYQTPSGALGMYQGVKYNMQNAVYWNILLGGALSDELVSANVGTGPSSIGATGDPTDERVMTENTDATLDPLLTRSAYNAMQLVRGSASEAIGLLKNYAPATSPALRGEMYAMQGYAELLLAEMYCSGVPLSTLDFQQDFTYQAGSTTDQVTNHAIALFDTAITLSADSSRILQLAEVGKGRALLDLGNYADAAAAVASVSETFSYQLPSQYDVGSGSVAFDGYSVSDREGENGLPFRSSNDPRTPVSPAGTNQFGLALYTPAIYGAPVQITQATLASGIEAQLIKAEAALNAAPNDPQWLTILNALRTTCTSADDCPSPAPAGTGGVAGLPPLSDPGSVGGSDSARVTLLFTERAYWLFVTAHRQGDLRRLVRNYHRVQNTVYPIGPYYGGRGAYGSDVNAPIPADERTNPKFTGCHDRSA
jgi:hypothetical protein